MKLFLLYFFTLFITLFFTLTKQQMHQRISQRKLPKNNNFDDFYLPKMIKLNHRDELIKMLKQRKNTCQFGRIRPLQIFVPKAKALPIKNIKLAQSINNNKNVNFINDFLSKNKKRQQQRHYSNKKVFSQSPPNLKIKPLNIQKTELPTIDDKTGKEEEIQNNNKQLQQQKLRFFYTPSNTVVNQDFTFATNTPGFACAYGLPTPLYNTPRKKCIPHSPLCGITFTCVMDVHAVDERGHQLENWWMEENKIEN